MTARSVVGWLPYESAAAREVMIGGAGGDRRLLTRATYLADWHDGARPHIEAVWTALDALAADGILVDGSTHQASRCPIFDDGTACALSMRAWGDLVSAWWNDRHPDAPSTYVTFAWEPMRPEAELLEALRADAPRLRALVALEMTP